MIVKIERKKDQAHAGSRLGKPTDFSGKNFIVQTKVGHASSRIFMEKLTASDFKYAYELPSLDRIEIIRDGIAPNIVKTVLEKMNMPQERVLSYLALPIATINRKIRKNELLSNHESTRILGFLSLIGQVQAMVERSGNPEGFDAVKWTAHWLEQPVPALGGHAPAEYLDTTVGQQMLSDLLAKIESGAYA